MGASGSRSSSDDYSTFELSGSKEDGRTFAHSPGAHAGPKGGNVDDLHNNFAVRTTRLACFCSPITLLVTGRGKIVPHK